MNEKTEGLKNADLAGKWILTIGVALMFIPGMITSFYGIHLSAGVESSLNALGYLSLPFIILGGLVFMITSMKLKKEAMLHAGSPVAEPRSWKSLIVWNVLAILLSIPTSFAIMFGGGMMGDSGTQSAYVTAYIIVGLGALYFFGTVFCVVMSQKKRSLKWTLWPMVLPVIVIGASMLGPLIISVFFSHTGL